MEKHEEQITQKKGKYESFKREKLFIELTGVIDSFEKYKELQESGRRIRIFLSEDDMDNPNISKEIQDKYGVSRTSAWRAKKLGYFNPNYLQKESFLNPELAEKLVDTIIEKSEITASIAFRRFGLNIGNHVETYKDLKQDIAEHLLHRVDIMKDVTDENRIGTYFFTIGVSKGMQFLSRYLRHSNRRESLYLDGESDHVIKPMLKINHIDPLEEENIELPVQLKPILRVFTEHGFESAAMMFNLDAKYEKLLSEVSARNNLLDRKNKMNNILSTIFDYFPDAHITRSNSGSKYISIPHVAKKGIFGVIRISDHKKSKEMIKKNQKIILDIYGDTQNWEEDILEIHGHVYGQFEV